MESRIDPSESRAPGTADLDLDLIASQILVLSEMAAREHLESIERSQADGLIKLVKGGAHVKTTGTWR